MVYQFDQLALGLYFLFRFVLFCFVFWVCLGVLSLLFHTTEILYFIGSHDTWFNFSFSPSVCRQPVWVWEDGCALQALPGLSDLSGCTPARFGKRVGFRVQSVQRARSVPARQSDWNQEGLQAARQGVVSNPEEAWTCSPNNAYAERVVLYDRHPDKNKDPSAEDMFIKITKSYEVG